MPRGKRRESAEQAEKRGGPNWRRALSSSSRRTPGSKDHRALDGNQEGIEPPSPPQRRRCRLFTSTQASCRRNIHCAEIHSRGSGTTAAPGPPLSRGKRRERGGIGKTRRAQSGGELSHRFPGERRDPETTELWTATKRASNHHSLRGTEPVVLQEGLNTVPAESSLR